VRFAELYMVLPYVLRVAAIAQKRAVFMLNFVLCAAFPYAAKSKSGFLWLILPTNYRYFTTELPINNH
jgi:hypothetical protein